LSAESLVQLFVGEFVTGSPSAAVIDIQIFGHFLEFSVRQVEAHRFI
jgi:hypothetical protein